jgi:nucleoside-diphosphate-sugar epimerase
MTGHADRHVLITGGAGYIGSGLVGVLLKNGFFVTVIDQLDFGGESLLGYISQSNFFFTKGDVAESGEIVRAVTLAQEHGAPPLSVIVHLSGTVGFPACVNAGREFSWRQNVDAVKRVFEQGDQLDAERFIFSSTYSNYGYSPNNELVTEISDLNPQSIYAETKIAAEEYLTSSRDAGCAPLIFRFATLFGASPRTRFDLMVNQFVLEAYSEGELLIFEKDLSRSLVHIRDILRGILMGIKADDQLIRGEIYNLGDESGNHTKDEMVHVIRRQLPETKVEYKDLSFDGDMRNIRVSFAKAKEHLGFKNEFDLDDGVTDVLNLLRSGLITDPHSDKFRNARLDIK